MTCVEKYFKDIVATNYKNRHVIIARCAHITKSQPIHKEQGRATCQQEIYASGVVLLEDISAATLRQYPGR